MNEDASRAENDPFTLEETHLEPDERPIPYVPIARIDPHARTAMPGDLKRDDSRRGISAPSAVGPTSDPSARFPIGRIISERYRIERQIARGGMGRVFLATQLPLGREVAIKILIPQSTDREFRRRFLLEASISARLVHRHIVTVHDYGETEDGDLYMAMEYLDGEPLAKAINRAVRLAPDRATRIAMQVCRALRAAHAKGVVHRDLKPSNIMLLREEEDGGESEVVKVLDFGLVKVFEAGGEAKPDLELTRAGTLLGSPKYMAPEQIRSLPVDPRTDIYSLGVILFHMLAGRAPFLGASSVEILNQHLKEPVPSIQAIVGPSVDIPPELEVIVRRAMEKAPSRRYASMDDLLGDLKAAHRLLSGATADLESMVVESPMEDLTSIAELGRARTPRRSMHVPVDPKRQAPTKTSFQAGSPLAEPSRRGPPPDASSARRRSEALLMEPLLRGHTHSATPPPAEVLAPAGTALGRALVYCLSAAVVMLAGYVSWSLFAPLPSPIPLPPAASASLIEKRPAPDPVSIPPSRSSATMLPKQTSLEPAAPEKVQDAPREGGAEGRRRSRASRTSEPSLETSKNSAEEASEDEPRREGGSKGERRERRDRKSTSGKTHAKSVEDLPVEKAAERAPATTSASETPSKRSHVQSVDDIDAARAKQVRVVDRPVPVVD